MFYRISERNKKGHKLKRRFKDAERLRTSREPRSREPISMEPRCSQTLDASNIASLHGMQWSRRSKELGRDWDGVFENMVPVTKQK